MKKYLSSFIAFLTLVMVLSVPVHAAAGQTDASKENLFKKLQAAKDSQVVLDSLEAYEKDGKRHVRVGKTRSADGHQESFEVEVDFKTNTYKVKNYTKKEVQQSEEKMSISAVNNYTATVTANTLDPVNILCNYSTLQWGWSEDTSTTGYPFKYRSRSLSWWDAQPTSLGTDWYYVRHEWHDPSDSGQSGFVQHVNYDFGGGLAGTTYAGHYISITPEPDGMYHYYVELETDGIAGNLLHLKIETN